MRKKVRSNCHTKGKGYTEIKWVFGRSDGKKKEQKKMSHHKQKSTLKNHAIPNPSSNGKNSLPDSGLGLGCRPPTPFPQVRRRTGRQH